MKAFILYELSMGEEEFRTLKYDRIFFPVNKVNRKNEEIRTLNVHFTDMISVNKVYRRVKYIKREGRPEWAIASLRKYVTAPSHKRFSGIQTLAYQYRSS